MFKYVLEKEWSLTFGQWEEGCIFARVFFPWGTNSVFNVELQKEMKKKVMSKNVKGIHRELSEQKIW